MFVQERKFELERVKNRKPTLDQELEENVIKLKKRMKNLKNSAKELKEESVKLIEKIQKNERNYFKDLNLLIRNWNLNASDNQLYVVCYNNIPVFTEKKGDSEGSFKLYLNKGF